MTLFSGRFHATDQRSDRRPRCSRFRRIFGAALCHRKLSGERDTMDAVVGGHFSDLQHAVHRAEVVRAKFRAAVMFALAARLAAPLAIDYELEFLMAGRESHGRLPKPIRLALEGHRIGAPIVERARDKNRFGVRRAARESYWPGSFALNLVSLAGFAHGVFCFGLSYGCATPASGPRPIILSRCSSVGAGRAKDGDAHPQ